MKNRRERGGDQIVNDGFNNNLNTYGNNGQMNQSNQSIIVSKQN